MSSRHRVRGSRPSLRSDYRDRGSLRSLPPGRSRVPLRRRRGDERRRILGVAQQRLPRSLAARLRGRGQRLRHLGAGRSADRRRRYLEARFIVPRALRSEHRRHRLPDVLSRDVGRRRVFARAQGPLARARPGHPSLLAFALGRREAVQDGRRARGRSQARSHRPPGRLPEGRRYGHGRRPRRPRARGRRGGQRRGGSRQEGRQAGAGYRHALCVFPRRRSVVRRFRHAGRSVRQARHDGLGDQSHAQGRDGARSADCRLR